MRESVTERLRENRLIDDALFARRMVEAGQRAGTGLFALKQKMRAKGIAEEVAEEALTAIGEDSQLSAARALAQKARAALRGPARRASPGKALPGPRAQGLFLGCHRQRPGMPAGGCRRV